MVVSCLRHFRRRMSGKRDLCAHCTGGWMEPETCPDEVAKKNPCTWGGKSVNISRTFNQNCLLAQCNGLSVWLLPRKSIPTLRLYRESQEDRSIFWEVIVSVILSKSSICTCDLFRAVSEAELFHCTVPKLLIRERYYLLFLIPVFIVKVTKLVQYS
jgi:hypothetical protein